MKKKSTILVCNHMLLSWLETLYRRGRTPFATGTQRASFWLCGSCQAPSSDRKDFLQQSLTLHQSLEEFPQWSMYKDWCCDQQVSPISAPLTAILDCLTLTPISLEGSRLLQSRIPDQQLQWTQICSSEVGGSHIITNLTRGMANTWPSTLGCFTSGTVIRFWGTWHSVRLVADMWILSKNQMLQFIPGDFLLLPECSSVSLIPHGEKCLVQALTETALNFILWRLCTLWRRKILCQTG